MSLLSLPVSLLSLLSLFPLLYFVLSVPPSFKREGQKGRDRGRDGRDGEKTRKLKNEH